MSDTLVKNLYKKETQTHTQSQRLRKNNVSLNTKNNLYLVYVQLPENDGKKDRRREEEMNYNERSDRERKKR